MFLFSLFLMLSLHHTMLDTSLREHVNLAKKNLSNKPEQRQKHQFDNHIFENGLKIVKDFAEEQRINYFQSNLLTHTMAITGADLIIVTVLVDSRLNSFTATYT